MIYQEYIKFLRLLGQNQLNLTPYTKTKTRKPWSASPEETLDVMIKHHFTGVSAEATPDTSQQEYETQSTNDTINQIINEDRLGKVINDMDPLKAAGPDQVQSILIQKAYKLIKKPLLEIYRQSHNIGYIPKPWREAKGIYLPKPGKWIIVTLNHSEPLPYHQTSSRYTKKMILWYIEHDLG